MKIDTSKRATRAEAEDYLRYDDDPILRGMIRDHLPLTRDNYIFLNWDKRPSPWTAEHEMSVPAIFRAEDAVPENPNKRPHKKATAELPRSAMDQNTKPDKALPNSSATTAPRAVTPRNGIVRSKHTKESLLAMGFKIIPPSGTGYVLPMGRPSKR